MFAYWEPSSAIILSILNYLVILCVSVANFQTEQPVIPLWIMFPLLWVIIPALAWILYFGSRTRSFDKSNYPRYIWDVKTWCISGILLWVLILVLYLVYLINYGFTSAPSFSAPFGDPEVSDYHFLIFVSTLASFIGFLAAIDALWADAFNSYYLAKLKVGVSDRLVNLDGLSRMISY